MEDEKIIDLYWAREQTAITETDKKYGRYCSKIAWNILYNKEDCEECVSDTWMRAWNRMPEERPGILSAFLGTITRNLSLDRYRKAHAGKRGQGQVAFVYEELQDSLSTEGPEERMEERALTEALNRFLERQKREHRMLFVRRYWYMDSLEEIAEKFGVSESKVKSDLFRLRKRLRVYLEAEGFVV